MEIFEVKIINPKATQVLKSLAAMHLISIRDRGKELNTTLNSRGSKGENAGHGINNDTYPYRPQYLSFNGSNYILHKKLDSNVAFEEGQFIITNDLLDITVWGKTRDEAEEAFAFTFHSLFENFAKESDKNLSPKARRLKKTLMNLIVKEE